MTNIKLIDVSPSDFNLIDPINDIISIAIKHTRINRNAINYCSIYSVLYDLMHAYKLTFIHPKTKKEMSFECPLPDYFLQIINNLN